MQNIKSNIGVIAFCSVFMAIGGAAIIGGLMPLATSRDGNSYPSRQGRRIPRHLLRVRRELILDRR